MTISTRTWLAIAAVLIGVVAGNFGLSSAYAMESRKPGDVFRDCNGCPEMVVIPPGNFVMGSVKGRKRELPRALVTIPAPLAFGRYEVTFDEWEACHADGGCEKIPTDRGWGRGKRPVMSVTLAEVETYLAWLSKKTGHKYRLPSEAEWEYAARAGTPTEYWWGNDMESGFANCRGCGTEWSGVKSAPVGRFKPNPWGLYDVHGNVLEMVSDCWQNNLIGIPTDGRPRKAANCRNRVVKGGAWYYLSKVSRSASRARNDARVYSYFIGFRVVRELN